MPLAPDQLPNDLDALKRRIVARTTELEAAQAELAAAKNGLLVTQLTIEKPKAHIAALRREKFGATSECVDRVLEQLELALEEAETAKAEVLRYVPGHFAVDRIGLLYRAAIKVRPGLTRYTSASAICSSSQPAPPSAWSALSRMRALRITFAAALPLEIKAFSRARSSASSSTKNFLAAMIDWPCRLNPTRQDSVFTAIAYESN